MLEGLAYLHSKGTNLILKIGIIHRDLKADNILLSSDNQIKIADLGTAFFNEKLKQVRDSTICSGGFSGLCETKKG